MFPKLSPANASTLALVVALHALAAQWLMRGIERPAFEPPRSIQVSLIAERPAARERAHIERRANPVAPAPVVAPPLLSAPVEAPQPAVVPAPAVGPAPTPIPVPEIAPPAPVAVAAPPAIAAARPAVSAPVETTPPRFDAAYLENPAPAYPAASRRLGEQGRVVLRVLVTPRGEPEHVELRTSSGHPRLDTAALGTVKRWRFVPAKQGSEAVQAWVLVPISFFLEG